MNKYFQNLNMKVRSRFVYISDIIFLIAAIVIVGRLLPLDLSVGISGMTAEQKADIHEILSTKMVKEGYFTEFFKVGYSAPYIQCGPEKNKYWIYNSDLQYAVFDSADNKFESLGVRSKKNMPLGLVLDNHILAVEEERIYYATMNGPYGWIDDRENFGWTVDGLVDYSAVTRLLHRGDSERLTFLQVAQLYRLIQQETLIGYSDGMAWFRVDDGMGAFDVIRCTANGELMRFSKNINYEEGIFVIENRYLIYGIDGELVIVDFQTGASRKLREEISIRGINYGIDAGGKIIICLYTEKQFITFDLPGNGVEYENVIKYSLEEFPLEAIVVRGQNGLSCWTYAGESFTQYES